MPSLPIAYSCLDALLSKFDRFTSHRTFILISTFLCYTAYHLSRKPISVVKSVLHQNCSKLAKERGLVLIPANATYCSWAPFEKEDYSQILGSLEYAYLLAYAIGMFVSGHIAERMNLRIFLAIGMILSGLATALFGLGHFLNIHSFTFYLVVQIFGGVVQSTGWPSVVTLMGHWFGKSKRGFIFGVWNSHTSVGNILGSLIAGYFVRTMWGLSFISSGMIIGLLGVIIGVTIVVHPEDAGLKSPNVVAPGVDSQEGRSLLTLTYGNSAPARTKPVPLKNRSLSTGDNEGQPITLWGALRIPGVLDYSMCLFFAKLVSYTLLYWLPAYLAYSGKNIDAKRAADFSTLFDAGGIAGGIAAGIISDKLGGRAGTCVIMLALGAPMLYIYEAIGTYNVATSLILLTIIGFLVNGPYALITTAVCADLGTHESLVGNSKALATVTAIIDGTGSMGAALGPFLTGFILNSRLRWSGVFSMLIISDVIAMLIGLGIIFGGRTPRTAAALIGGNKSEDSYIDKLKAGSSKILAVLSRKRFCLLSSFLLVSVMLFLIFIVY